MSERRFDDYLWHASGRVDWFISTLESLLARYRYDEGPRALMEQATEADGESPSEPPQP